MSTLLRRIFSRKTFVRLAFALACLVTLLIALWMFENWRGQRAWAAYRAAAEKRGERLWLKDFVTPPVPDAENFAAIPIIQEIFAASAANKEVPNPFTWNFQHDGRATPLLNRTKAGRVDLVKSRDILRDLKMLAQPTENPGRDILTGLARYEPALQQLRDAARRPRSRFPVKWEDGFMARIPHMGALQNAAHIIALRMCAHLALGESAAALADWHDGLALYRAMEHEPVLICGLVRLAILRQMESAVSDGLAARQWADPELHALSADLASLQLLADMQFALASERGGMNGVFDSFATRDPFVRSHDLQMLAGSPSESSASSPFFSMFFPTGWVRASQVKVNELYDQHLARLDLAKGVIAGGPSIDAELDALIHKNIITRWPYAFAALLMPALDGFTAKYAATHTNTQQARAACALELFRRARGTFPERLDVLVPEFLDAVPRDVMDGAPQRYRREGESFALWSIGANRVDDGGTSEPAKITRKPPDWVWRATGP